MKPRSGHRCSLPGALRTDSSDTHLPPVLPGTSVAARILRRFRMLLLVSPDHPETRSYYRSRTKLSAENKRLVCDLPPFIVHPFSTFRRFWEAIIYVVLTLHLYLLAFMVAFAPHLKPATLLRLQLADVVLCGLLGLEFTIKLVTGYVSEDGSVELNPRMIVRYRLRWWNVVNRLLLVVPYVLLLDELVHAFYNNSALAYLTFAIYLYLLCIWRFRAVNWYFRTLALGTLGLSERQLRLIEPILDTLYVLHWTACLVYIVPLLALPALDSSASATNFLVDVLWIHDHRDEAAHISIANRTRLPIGELRMHLQTVAELVPDNAAFLEARLTDLEQHVTVPYRYLRALMFTLKISLQGGHSLAVGHHFLHEWTQALLLLAGWLWSTYVLLLFIRALQTADAAATQYDEALNELGAFCRTERLSLPTRRKMARQLAGRFRGRFFDERPIFAHASDNLRRRLRTEIGVLGARLARSEILRDLPNYLLQDIAGRLKFEVVLEQDTIVSAGGPISSMFFLSVGTAAVYTPEGIELGHLVDGSSFGEIGLLRTGATHPVKVVALEPCELYRLERTDFLQLMRPHSSLLAQLSKQAERRISEANTLTLEDRLFETFFY